jgi:heat shock protein HslJ
MRSRVTSICVAFAVLTLAACAPSTPAAPPPAATAVAVATTVSETQSELALANTSWQLETMWPPEMATPVVPGTDVTLGFGVDRYTGFAGCDWYMGMYNASESELEMQQPAKTIGGCVNKPTAADQQATFLSMLTNSTTYKMEGDNLVFYNSANQQMMSLKPLESLPFEGTTWQMLFSFTTRGGVWTPALSGAKVTATFDGTTLSGNAGCNDYSATYKLQGDRVDLDAIAVTQKMCSAPEGVMEQEQAYLEMLASAKVISQYPRSFELLTLDLTPLLAYHAQ